MQKATYLKMLGALGSVIIGISAFLPWIKIGILHVSTTVRGVDDYDGWVAVFLGIVGVVLLFTKPKLTLIPAVFALGLAVYEWLDFYSAYVNNQEVMDKGVVAQIGIGLYLLPAGAVLLGLTSFFIKGSRE